MNSIIQLILGFVAIALTTSCSGQTLERSAFQRDYSLEVQVKDADTGELIENALVKAVFDDGKIQEKTNDKGFVTLTGKVIYGAAVSVNIPGYYRTGRTISTRNQKKKERVTLKIRKRGRPVSLYAKRFNGTIPVVSDIAGFDLEVGDWVKPFGDGNVSDLNFQVLSPDNNEEQHWALIVSIVRDGDILGDATKFYARHSEMKLSAYPIFESEFKRLEFGHFFQKGNMKISHYHLRARTVLDENGEVVSAHYGRIQDGFLFMKPISADGLPNIEFTYYFNPRPNEKNLELKRGKNLFPAKGMRQFRKLQAP